MKECASLVINQPVSLSILTSVLFGCRAAPPPDAGFIANPEHLAPDSKLPFDDVWFKEGLDLQRFKTVYIAPIDTTHLLKLSWWDRWNLAPGDEQKQAQQIADYFSSKLTEAFTNDEHKKLVVATTPQKDSLIIELAITEVVPTKLWLNTIGVLLLGPMSQGTTAFEGRFRDGQSQQVLAEFKDREYGQVDIVSVADFAWFKHSEHTIRSWSDNLVQICYRAPGQAIAPMSTVTLRPW